MNNNRLLQLLGGFIVKRKNIDNKTVCNNQYLVALHILYFNEYIYFPITEKLFLDSADDSLKVLLGSLQGSNISFLDNGSDLWKPDKDYFLSYSLNSDINIKNEHTNLLESVLTTQGILNSDYYEDLYFVRNKDLSNIKYFFNQNKLIKLNIDENTIRNFRASFMKSIYNANYNSDNTLYEYSNVDELNIIYPMIVKYFMEEDLSTDITYKRLSTLIKTSSSNSKTGCTSCSDANSIFNTDNNSSTSCSELYVQSMQQWLSDMFSDPDFYCQWFITKDLNEPNKELCDYLEKLIDGLLISDYNISLENKSLEYCNCNSIYDDETKSCSNKQYIENFKQVLEWIKNNELDAHINQIKIYGKQFGNILYKLEF